jgi:hypothetical protein
VSGQTDLETLLASMSPRLSAVEFAFATFPGAAAARPIPGTIATLLEEEGLSIVAPACALAEAGIEHKSGWAQISLTVHSSLEAVGLTAKIATALAADGISANVVAGYFHDHLFVPWHRRDDAMSILAALASGVPQR